jgi:hypothetical protein
MERHTQPILIVTSFLGRIIQEYGHYLFMGFAYFCFALLIWMFTRRRKRPVHDISVVILPLSPAPRRDPVSEPVLFREHSEF